MFQSLASAAALLLLSGCATAYQSAGLTGGHFEQKMPGKLEMVAFAANGFTSGPLAQRYALYRCAEIAKARNKPFFMMYGSLFAAAHDRPAEMPRVGAALDKPIATAFVLMLDAPHPGAHNTDDVLTDLQAVIDSGKIEKEGP